MGSEWTKNVNTLQKPIINYGWWRLFGMAWNDKEMSMRKWSIDANSVLPNETTHRREWRVVGSNVSSGSLSKLTHLEPTNNIEANCWGILPRWHKVLLWQLFKTIQGRIFARSPNAARWRHQLNSGVDLQFCPPSTCLIRYLFDTLQLAPWWPISTHTTYLSWTTSETLVEGLSNPLLWPWQP